jgi:hypothetical protein
MNIYILPIVYSTIIYARLLYFLRHQTPQVSRTQQGRRAQRDFIVIRRILFTVITLTLPGLPNVAFVLMVNIDHRFADAYYIYRIQWLGPAVTIFIFSIALIFINPQIKEIFTNFMRRENHVVPTMMPIRTLQQPSILMETRV